MSRRREQPEPPVAVCVAGRAPGAGLCCDFPRQVPGVCEGSPRPSGSPLSHGNADGAVGAGTERSPPQRGTPGSPPAPRVRALRA